MVNKKAALVRRLFFLSPYPHAHGGLFRVHPLPEFSGHLRNRNMIENEKSIAYSRTVILPLSKSFFPLLQHASSIIAEGYEHACEISELAFTAPAERLFLDCDSAEQAAFNKNIVRRCRQRARILCLRAGEDGRAPLSRQPEMGHRSGGGRRGRELRAGELSLARAAQTL